MAVTIRTFVNTAILIFASCANVCAQQINNLQPTLQRIADKYTATIGFSALDLENGKIYSVNGNKHLPMQSVYKFHLALAVLSQVDQGTYKLDEKIHIKQSDLLPDTHSPLREKYPNGDISISLAELLTYTVGQSDNNGCDILFRLLGGPAKVNSFIHMLGVQHVEIVATEEEMHKNEKVQFTNWTTPDAAIQLLNMFYKKKILSEQLHAFLWKVMTESASGPKKIKGQLPEGTLVAHKTGYSGADNEGVTAASNDIGIVTMPNGKHFAIAAFISNTKENEEVIDRIIAELTRAVWDEFSK
ncbi:MAG: class A beta-lactamase, subclass A2 [Flavobacterium sp.]|nr:MAG: class A beta-lactamase, subclass A2 [Flavobacterium sp.]